MNAISPPPSNLCHLYQRVSSGAQLVGSGLDRQVDTTAEYVARKGLEIVRTYSDRGVSAFRGKNRKVGELSLILRHIETGIIRPGEHLIIESIDRLSRQPVLDALDTLKLVLAKGVVVHSVYDNIHFTLDDLNKDVTRIFALVMSMGRANEESRVKSTRVARAHARGRASGSIVAGRVPSWLEVVRNSEGKKVFKVKDTIVDAERGMTHADIVEDMFKMSASGLSSYRIAQVLMERGIAPFGESRRRIGSKATAKHVWNATSIIDMLSRKTAIGEFRSHTTSYDPETGKRIQTLASVNSNYYPAIVSEELWQKANAAMRDRKRRKVRGPNGATFANLFRDLTVCAHCGGAMHIRVQKETAGGARFTRLRCASRSENACVNRSTPRYEPIEPVLLTMIRELEFNDRRSEEVAALDKLIAADQVRYDGLGDEIRAIIEGMLAGTLAKDIVREMVKAREEQRDAAKASLEANQTKRDAIAARESHADRHAALLALQEQMASATGNDLYEMRTTLNLRIKESIDRIVFEGDGTATVHLNGTDDRYVIFDITRETVSIKRLAGDASWVSIVVVNGDIAADLERLKTPSPEFLIGVPHQRKPF